MHPVVLATDIFIQFQLVLVLVSTPIHSTMLTDPSVPIAAPRPPQFGKQHASIAHSNFNQSTALWMVSI